MKLNKIIPLVFPDVKIIQFSRFVDERGFFSEVFKKSDFQSIKDLSFFRKKEIKQINVSYSKKNVVRGMHFQLNPGMDKLVRVVKGAMIDLFLDLRKGSRSFGKIEGYKLTANNDDSEDEYIWLPFGFAHGVVFLEDTTIEYLCTAEYNPKGEFTISPLAKDLDWSSLNSKLKAVVDKILKGNLILSEKDKNGMTLEEWKSHPSSAKMNIR